MGEVLDFRNVARLYNKGQLIEKVYSKGVQIYPAPPAPPAPPLLWLKGDDLTDSSANSFVVQNVGTGVIVDNLIKKYGTGSLYFDNQSHLAFNSSKFALGVSNFTIELWLYLTESIGNVGVWTFATSESYPVTSYLDLNFYSNQSRNYATSYGFDYGLLINEWHHLAVVRKNGILSLYVDGVVSPTTINFNSDIQNTFFLIGLYLSSQYRMTGYIDSFRFSLEARYLSNFNPETDTGLAY